MSRTFNIYCDESCHLEHDGHPVMVLGAIWCPKDKVRQIATRLREIKVSHGLPPDFEVKWTKVSPGQEDLYREILDYFFDNDDLHFRCVVASKVGLHHEKFEQDHDDWYYKMYFNTLKVLLTPHDRYNIYLDIKDTHSAGKSERLWDVLCNNMYDFSRSVIREVQPVRSHHVEQIQLADLLIGAVSYANRELSGSNAKQMLVARMRDRSGYSLTKSTLLREEKVNLLVWHPHQGTED